MAEVYDLSEISAHVRAAIKRSGIKRKPSVARMQRFTRIADMLLDPEISFQAIACGRDLTVSDFYGAMWLLLVADTFRGHGERTDIVGDFFEFTQEDVALLGCELMGQTRAGHLGRCRHSLSEVTPKSSARRAYIAAADQYLECCFADETAPHVNEFAREAGVSPRSLTRAFIQEAGIGVSTYFKNARIRRAQHLLATTGLSITAVAYAAGFGTRVTFFRAFKAATGYAPEELRSGGPSPSNAPKLNQTREVSPSLRTYYQ